MARIYIYADESGNLDYDGAKKGEGSSPYFGFGTITVTGDHPEMLWSGLSLRSDIESAGTNLPKGFHAKDDRHSIREEVFSVISGLDVRFDSTFLCKTNAYEYVRKKGEMHLYKMAWYLHMKYVVPDVSGSDDEIVVIAGTFGTKARQKQAREAITDVCNQLSRSITLCIWEASSSWGIQVADYCLWADHRNLDNRQCKWFEPVVSPLQVTRFAPWGYGQKE